SGRDIAALLELEGDFVDAGRGYDGSWMPRRILRLVRHALSDRRILHRRSEPKGREVPLRPGRTPGKLHHARRRDREAAQGGRAPAVLLSRGTGPPPRRAILQVALGEGPQGQHRDADNEHGP